MAHLDYARAHFKVVFAEKSMERRQGFFSTLREEVARGLSPARSRERSSETGQHLAEMLVPRRRNGHGRHPSLALPSAPDSAAPVARSMSFRETLAPLMEGPEGGDAVEADRSLRKEGWGQWVRSQLTRAPSVTTLSFSVADSAGAASSFRHSNLRLLLGVMGAPLAPVHASSADRLPHVRIKDTPIETSSAQYIIQQYTAATSGNKLHRSIRNAYAMGKVRMVASELENSSNVVKNRSGSSRTVESGGFVLWQMAPDMWYVELAVGGSKVRAGSNGTVVWRHTPWLGAHAAKGPIRPLRRALQGLDPFTTASMFANARCIGEKEVNGEDCFILKLCADPQTLGARSEGPAEIIRHVLFGYFSQRTGLLVLMEDSHLTRIQANAGCDAVYWETTISSLLNDYRLVEGVMIAHSGRSNVTLFKFGETAMSHSKTRMEEEWTIEEVAYNVPGLSVDCFIPPADIRCGSVGETRALPCGERTKTSVELQPKVAAIEKPKDMLNKIIWKLKV